VRMLQKAGHTAYWAGGCVRDKLLGKTPKDYDLATSAPPETVRDLFPGSIGVGKAFGVIRVPLEKHWFEIATFRKDENYEDGRHPEKVSFSDPETDACRRDFTVNAIFFDPIAEKIHDFVGGQNDINAKLIRCVGHPSLRFKEDHLRLLRAARFASVLDFTIENETSEAIRAHAASIKSISGERLRDELLRLLSESPRPGDAVMLLESLGLLSYILPEVAATMGVTQPPNFHPEGDVFQHTVLMLNLLASGDDSMPPATSEPHSRGLLATAILLHDIGKPPTRTVEAGRIRFNQHAKVGATMADKALRRLRFSNADRETITHSIERHMAFKDVQKMRPSKLRAFMASPCFPLELDLHRLDCLSSNRKLENCAFLESVLKDFDGEEPLPKPWVSGNDILDIGIPPGPKVGYWHRKTFEAQLDGEFESREEALAWLKENVRKRFAE